MPALYNSDWIRFVIKDRREYILSPIIRSEILPHIYRMVMEIEDGKDA